MRKLILFTCMVVLMMAFSTTALAKQFTINYTADDAVLDIWYSVDGGGFSAVSGFMPDVLPASSAANSNSWTGDLTTGDNYTLIFRIQNESHPGTINPTALLANIIGQFNNVSTENVNWEAARFTGTGALGLDWQTATGWAMNDGTWVNGFDSSIWNWSTNAPITGLPIDAMWIGFGDYPGHSDATAETISYFKVTFSDTPLPAAVWLMGSGLLGLLGFRRLRNS